MTLLLGSKSSALLPRASPGSTTASQVGLTNTGIKCATCGWMDAPVVQCGWMCTGKGTKDLSTSTPAVSRRGSNSSLIPSAGGGDEKGCSNIRQPASLLRGCSSCEAWLSFKQQEETVSPFPRSLADNSGDCKCLAKCFLSHFANKAGVRSFLPVEI